MISLAGLLLLAITSLKVQSYKLYNNKCMIALTQILYKVLFINRKDNRNY